MNEFLKPIIKRLNNFKLTALFAAIAGLVSIALVVLLFVLYSRSGVDPNNGEVVTAFLGTKQNPSPRIVGMIYFLFCIVTIILDIAIIYVALPFMFPRDKMNPNKALPWLVVANGALHIGLVGLVIHLLISEKTRMAGGFITYIILGALLIIYCMLFIIPALKCHFYMPSLLDENVKEEKISLKINK